MTFAIPDNDIEQIRRLKARYFRFMDTKQWDAWKTLFTDDVVVIVDTEVTTFGKEAAPMPRRQGVEDFVSSTRSIIEMCTTVHHGHMPEIDVVSESTATGIWAMEDIVEYPDGQCFHGHGHYHETYRKQGGEWRIASLHLTRIRVRATMNGHPG